MSAVFPNAWMRLQALGWALVLFVWKGALVGGATALALRLRAVFFHSN